MNSIRNVLMATAVAMMLLDSGSAFAVVTESYDRATNTETFHYISARGDESALRDAELNFQQNNPGVNMTEENDFKSPEIDATSGTSAITFLTGVLTLAWKRSRSRQSAKSS